MARLLLATTLTAGGEKMVTSVDYTVDILVNEPVQTLQEIITLTAPTGRKKLTSHLVVTQNFLKYQYIEHAKNETDSVRTSRLNPVDSL